MKNYDKKDHTFVICAYCESEFLEECIRSLMEQTVKTQVCIATSTPNEHILGLAKKYQLPVYVNTGEKGLAGDWNFALECAQTSLVTLAHQDDAYEKDYVKKILETLKYCKRPLIVFSDYNEIRYKKVVTTSMLLKVKRWMLIPLLFRPIWRSRFVRRRILALGNAICCPSVTYIRENLGGFKFINNMKSNIDWQAWEEISKLKGEFAYIGRPMMQHRIHEEATTSKLLEINGREQEDFYMFCKFWPEMLAKFMTWIYGKNEKSSKLQ